MADIIKTIGASGADYTTIAAWWAARSGTAGDKYIGVLIDAADYTGGEFSGVYSGDAVELYASPGVALDFSNPSAPHARIVATTGSAMYWRCIKPTLIKGVEMITAATNVVSLRLSAFEDADVTVENCWIRGGSDTVTHGRATAKTKLKNCVVSGGFTWGVANSFAGVTLENVVIVGNNTSNNVSRGGCRKDVAGCTLTNVVAVSNGVIDFYGSSTTSTVSFLASGGSSATGSNALTGVTTAAFTNYASNIFTAASGGVLDGTGPSSTDRGINLAAADTITISSPAPWQVVSRNKTTNTGSILIQGSYTGSPSAIEARFNGGAWSVIQSGPTGGTYSGTLPNQPSGNGLLEVRFANATAVTGSVDNVAIGAKVLFWGQSNFSGRANNPQTYTGPSGWFHKYTVTNPIWQVGADPFDSGTVNGSIFPLLANLLVPHLNCPVGFIGVAQGSTQLSQWQLGQTLNTRMLSYIASSGGNDIEVIASWIGEGDAGAATPEATFKSQYSAVINQLKAQTNADSMLVAVSGFDNVDYANVRQWIADIAAANGNVGNYVPQIWPLYQKLHYETDLETAAAANEIFDGFVANFYSNPATGVPANEIPSTGASGPSCLYNDVVRLGLAPTDLVKCEVVTPPSYTAGFTMQDNGSFSFTGAPDGVYTFQYRMLVNGTPSIEGVKNVKITIG